MQAWTQPQVPQRILAFTSPFWYPISYKKGRDPEATNGIAQPAGKGLRYRDITVFPSSLLAGTVLRIW